MPRHLAVGLPTYQSPWRRVGGSSWVQLLVVAGILVLVAGVVVPNGDRSGDRSETGLAKYELRNVQVAVDALMADNNLRRLRGPSNEPTNDMTAFPDPSSPAATKGLTSKDKDGYVLFGHDKTPDGGTDVLEYYARIRLSLWKYTVAEDGKVTQHAKIVTKN